jgi:hypothetical protein
VILVAAIGSRHNPITEGVGAARHNRPTLLDRCGHTNNLALDHRLDDATLHHRAGHGANHRTLDNRMHNTSRLDNAPLDHRLDDLPHDDAPLHDRLDDAAFRDATFHDLALNARLVVILFDTNPTTGERYFILVLDNSTLNPRPVEGIAVVLIENVAASTLSLGRSRGQHNRPAQCQRGQANKPH